MDDNLPAGHGAHGFFAAWLLLHEKADDWLKNAMERARSAPGESRKDYQTFLLEVDREKELLKGLFGEMIVGELKAAGFVHRDDSENLKAEMELMRERIAGLEERLDRLNRQK